MIHQGNIIIHIICGSLSLILGLLALLTVKGKKAHNRIGKYFLITMTIVVITGMIGVFAFGQNLFLLVITVLAGYVSFSGIRTLKTKSNIPKRIDIIVAIGSLFIVSFYLYYFNKIGMYWNSVITYSTVSALIFIVSYDLLRYFIPRKAYKQHKIWIYEHIYKMTSAFGGLLGAFSGTVLEDYKPYSIYVPTVFSFAVIFGFWIYTKTFGLIIYRKNKKVDQ